MRVREIYDPVEERWFEDLKSNDVQTEIERNDWLFNKKLEAFNTDREGFWSTE